MLQPGQVIANKYRVDRLLGEGGMGTVWVATNQILEKRVALKVMGEDFRSQPEWVARFFREAVAASKARHPGVVEVYDAGEHEGAPWMAMELLEGESLRDRLRREGRLPAEDAVRILGETLDALAAVHAVGVVHRDLKPDNVFLERTGGGERAKVLDFGIAKEAEQIGTLTKTGTIVGTAHYLAPEQARDSKTVDPRTDLYAIGVMIFECLSGQMPYEAETVPELIAKMYSQPPRDLGTLVPEVPAPLRHVVHACLAHDPSGRPPDATTLASQLRASLSDATRSDGAVPGRTETGPVSSPSPAWQQVGYTPTAAMPSAPPPAMTPAQPPAKRSSAWPWILGGIAALVLLIATPIVLVVGFGMWAATSAIENAEEISENIASSALDFDLPQGGRAMMLVDCDGDGTEDVVGSIMRFDGGSDAVSHLAAYDGHDGHRLWISAPLGSVESHAAAVTAVAGQTLLVATSTGDVHGYDARDGQPVWDLNVGERPERFCASDGRSAILETVDERRTRIALSDGTTRPDEGEVCMQLMGARPHDWRAGAMLTPPWRARRASERGSAEGIRVDATFDDGERTFVSGQRASGTGIPRVGVVGAWQIDVPGVAPLTAEASAPEALFLGRDEVFVAYAMDADAPSRLTALALEDGARRFDVALTPSRFDPSYVQVGSTRIAVGHGSIVDVLNRADGRTLFHLGR